MKEFMEIMTTEFGARAVLVVDCITFEHQDSHVVDFTRNPLHGYGEFHTSEELHPFAPWNRN